MIICRTGESWWRRVKYCPYQTFELVPDDITGARGDHNHSDEDPLISAHPTSGLFEQAHQRWCIIRILLVSRIEVVYEAGGDISITALTKTRAKSYVAAVYKRVTSRSKSALRVSLTFLRAAVSICSTMPTLYP